MTCEKCVAQGTQGNVLILHLTRLSVKLIFCGTLVWHSTGVVVGSSDFANFVVEGGDDFSDFVS